MAKKERDYDKILKNLQKAKETIQTINQNAKKLDIEADAAKQILKDKVGQKDCAVIKEVAKIIINVTKSGTNEIEELERSIKIERQKFEELER